MPGVANAKTLKDIFEWIYNLALAFFAFALDVYSFNFHKTFSKFISKIIFIACNKIKSPALSAGLLFVR
jgi:hypothetical protein